MMTDGFCVEELCALTADAHGCCSPEQVGTPVASVGLLGLCSDLNSTYMQGPARAPSALRAAIGCDSANSYAELGDCFTGKTVCACCLHAWWRAHRDERRFGC